MNGKDRKLLTLLGLIALIAWPIYILFRWLDKD